MGCSQSSHKVEQLRLELDGVLDVLRILSVHARDTRNSITQLRAEVDRLADNVYELEHGVVYAAPVQTPNHPRIAVNAPVPPSHVVPQ